MTESSTSLLTHHLDVGDTAPDFTLPSHDGDFSLSHYLGGLDPHQRLILYFYPKNFTAGCTDQACQLRDLILKDTRFSIVGISRDACASHAKFKKAYDLPFSLLSDIKGDVCQMYNCWVEKSMYGKRYFGIERSTFLIHPKGHILALWRKVKIKNHIEDITSNTSLL